MHVRKTKRTSRLKAALLTVLATASMALLGSSRALAAELSVGGGKILGGTICADVQGGTLANGNPVDAFSCSAALNQQFQFNSPIIVASVSPAGGPFCLSVDSPFPAPAGTPVVISQCNGQGNQQWEYINGFIINALFLPSAGAASTSVPDPPPLLCLDAGDMTNGTQLVVNDCSGLTGGPITPSQQWQIK